MKKITLNLSASLRMIDHAEYDENDNLVVSESPDPLLRISTTETIDYNDKALKSAIDNFRQRNNTVGPVVVVMA